ncbi:hypothetical protein LOD99_8768 [Oopsacas minuta]|uniref:DUF4371 domain-containing protein n=1 Tax=Oopsacas minuta TaxID=111878 RepID=A0AAV7JF80_9METZ|nr:hypothetical protein LOD99_8768 [Oopsacas minuta]
METLACLAKQNIAIRGHKGDLKTICETSNSNRGNFLELLHLRGKDLPWFKEKFEELNNRHRMWLSPEIQNGILDLIESNVTKIISDEVIESRMYSIIGYETLDISLDEQCSLYLHCASKGMIKEKFIGFYLAKSTTAKALFELVTEALKDLNLDPSYIVGQGYDGASNMKGKREDYKL